MRTDISTVALLCILSAAASAGTGNSEVLTAFEQPVTPAPPLEQPGRPPRPPAEMKSEGLVAGWNGEHFFIRSADGTFILQPYGYVQLDYRAYWGEGVPANTFAIRRARFGFMG